MTNWSITVGRDEILRVTELLTAHRPSEIDGEGVFVRSANGHRVWSVQSEGVMWEVDGAPCSDHLAPRCLPDRLVWNARHFAFTDGTLDITIDIPDDSVARARCELGEVIIDLPRQTEVPRVPMYFQAGAVIGVSAAQLHDLCRRAYIAPVAPSDAPVPTAMLFAEDGEIAIGVDWSVRGCARSTYRIPAAVEGEASRPVRLSTLMELLGAVDLDEDIVIEVPRAAHVPMVVSGDHYRLVLDPVPNRVARHHDRLEEVLTGIVGSEVRTLDTCEFAVALGGSTIHVDVVDAPSESIRMTTDVCAGLRESVELFEQINESNSGLANARFWFEDGVVRARTEVPVAAMNEVANVLRELERQVRGFDVFLSGYGIGA